MKKTTFVFVGISLAIMLVALVLSLCGLGINYGLDFAGQYRNLPFIGVLKPEAYENV